MDLKISPLSPALACFSILMFLTNFYLCLNLCIFISSLYRRSRRSSEDQETHPVPEGLEKHPVPNHPQSRLWCHTTWLHLHGDHRDWHVTMHVCTCRVESQECRNVTHRVLDRPGSSCRPWRPLPVVLAFGPFKSFSLVLRFSNGMALCKMIIALPFWRSNSRPVWRP